MEIHDIRSLRVSYIRSITKYRAEGRPIVYTDETYLHEGHPKPQEWTDGFAEDLKSPIGKGRRLIVVYAGGEFGFIPNGLLIFKSGQRTGDYIDDMNFTNYKKWLEEQLIPNLPERSVLVVDNASYHNVLAVKHPTQNTKKNEMIQWLNETGIVHDVNSTKIELYRIIKLHKPVQNMYTIDVILAKHGHSVIRLPLYHPELNPIEKIWGIVKNGVASKNVDFKLNSVEELARQKFSEVGPDVWQQCAEMLRISKKRIYKRSILWTSFTRRS